MKSNIVLIGFMGTGKSAVGKTLARRLGFSFYDTDYLVQERAGMSVADIFTNFGEAEFRRLEGEVVRRLMYRERVIIATGGGIVLNRINIERLKEKGVVVLLWATPEVIHQRTRHRAHRPLLRGPNPLPTIRRLLKEREPLYRAAADVVVQTGGKPVNRVADEVMRVLAGKGYYYFQDIADGKDRRVEE